jgi:hypothetical protein
MVDLSRPGDYISVDLVIFDTPYYIYISLQQINFCLYTSELWHHKVQRHLCTLRRHLYTSENWFVMVYDAATWGLKN